MKRGKPLRRRSPKREALDEQRATFRIQRLLKNPRCQGCPTTPVGATPPRPATDVHELVRRSQGGSILSEENTLCLCRRCHQWVTEHPADAVALGLARWSWQAGTPNGE